MTIMTRRNALTLGAGAAAGMMLPPWWESRAAIPIADVSMPNLAPETGATLRVLRPTKFVDPDEVFWRQSELG